MKNGMLAGLAILLVGLGVAAIWFTSSDRIDAPATKAESSETTAALAPNVATTTSPSDTPTNRGATTTGSAGRTPAGVIAASERVADGLKSAMVEFGNSDPNVVAAVDQALALCGDVPSLEDFEDPRSGLKAGLVDPKRLWATDKLVSRCEGLNSKDFKNVDRSRSTNLLLKRSRGDMVGALDTAEKIVANEVNQAELGMAGRMLLEKDRLPLREIFGAEPDMGRMDLAVNWAEASRLATCGQQLGCGADSLTTLQYCAIHGCDEGVDFRGAMSQSLAPRDFRAVDTFSRWMLARKPKK